MNIAIRISNSFEQITDVIEQLSRVVDKMVIYEHNATRVHIHGLLVNCKISTDTIKNYVKRALSVTAYPKSDWSFKTIHEGNPVDDNFIVYMSKGCLQPSFVYGYTASDIECYRMKWVQKTDFVRKKELTQYKIKLENPKEARLRQNEMMDMVRQRCRENHIIQPRDILEVIKEVVYKECRTVVGRYKIRDFYDYVSSELREKQWMDDMVKLISYKEL